MKEIKICLDDEVIMAMKAVYQINSDSEVVTMLTNTMIKEIDRMRSKIGICTVCGRPFAKINKQTHTCSLRCRNQALGIETENS